MSPRAPSNGCTSAIICEVQRALRGADVVAVLALEAVAGEVAHELVAAHADRAVAAPTGSVMPCRRNARYQASACW